MLRISIHDKDDETTLKLEGKLVGPWIGELVRTCDGLMPFSTGKKLCLDLRGMTFVDRKGVEMLRRIWRFTSAGILADTPLTRDFAKKICGTESRKKTKEKRDA